MIFPKTTSLLVGDIRGVRYGIELNKIETGLSVDFFRDGKRLLTGDVIPEEVVRISTHLLSTYYLAELIFDKYLSLVEEHGWGTSPPEQDERNELLPVTCFRLLTPDNEQDLEIFNTHYKMVNGKPEFRSLPSDGSTDRWMVVFCHDTEGKESRERVEELFRELSDELAHIIVANRQLLAVVFAGPIPTTEGTEAVH